MTTSIACAAAGLLRVAIASVAVTQDVYHGIVIDAGSSGSRIHLFEWQAQICEPNAPLPLVVPTQLGSTSIRPGLAPAGDTPGNLNHSLAQLLQFAKKALVKQEERWRHVPIYLFATAGLRRQPPDQRDHFRGLVTDLLSSTPFHFEPDFVRILSGEEEGAYGWLALNAQLGVLGQPDDNTLGVLDLGGASLQVTFLPVDNREVLQHSYPVILSGRQTNLYASSYLQFGVFEAHRLLQQHIIARTLIAEKVMRLEHPCYPRGGAFSDNLIPGIASDVDPPLKAVWHGKGSYDECEAKIEELFDKRAACFHPPCTFDGRYQPRLGSRRFVAFSTLSWIVQVLALPANATTVEDIENAARYVCKMEWSILQSRWHELKEDALRTLCFSATYAVVLLSFGLGFDKQGHQIVFNSDDWSRGNIPSNISWALGAMIWEINNRYSLRQPICSQRIEGKRTSEL